MNDGSPAIGTRIANQVYPATSIDSTEAEIAGGPRHRTRTLEAVPSRRLSGQRMNSAHVPADFDICRLVHPNFDGAFAAVTAASSPDGRSSRRRHLVRVAVAGGNPPSKFGLTIGSSGHGDALTAQLKRFRVYESQWTASDFRFFRGIDGRGRQLAIRVPIRGTAIVHIEEKKEEPRVIPSIVEQVGGAVEFHGGNYTGPGSNDRGYNDRGSDRRYNDGD